MTNGRNTISSEKLYISDFHLFICPQLEFKCFLPSLTVIFEQKSYLENWSSLDPENSLVTRAPFCYKREAMVTISER